MVILAGAIIITLNNSGIIDRASNAVDETNQDTIKELAQLGWAEAYIEHGADVAKLQEGVKNILIKNNINPEDYTIVVTKKGVEIKREKNINFKINYYDSELMELVTEEVTTLEGTTWREWINSKPDYLNEHNIFIDNIEGNDYVIGSLDLFMREDGDDGSKVLASDIIKEGVTYITAGSAY